MDYKEFRELGRRKFLALGPACALGSGLLSSKLAAAAGSLGRLAGANPQDAVSIGYWDGSEALASFDGLAPTAEPLVADAGETSDDRAADAGPERADLIAAEALGEGDPRFARKGAKVRIHGMFPIEAAPAEDLASLSLDVYFKPYHGAPFHAWGFVNGSLPSVCSPTAFTAPIAQVSGLNLCFEITDAGERRGPSVDHADREAPAHGASASAESADPTMTQVWTRFSLGREAGLPKLRRGVYLIAWRGRRARPLPSWRQYRVLTAAPRDTDRQEDIGPEAQPFRVVRRRDESTPADLTYALLSVDYADGSATIPA